MKAEEDGGDGEMKGHTCSSPDISDMSDHEASDDEEDISVDRNT